MMTIRSKLIALLLSVLVSAPFSIIANSAESIAFPSQEWSFNGPFGTFDRGELQRGLQVYKEVCATCHSLNFISFRNLADLGFNEDEVKAIAAEFQVKDGPNNEGEMFERAAIPSDVWPAPYANDNAARASNNGALPPDLSLMVDARAGGADYIYALLSGYHETPAGKEVGEGMYYNAYYPGNQIAMPSPLVEDGVEYGDGTRATLVQQARDVSAFLAWATEPNMEQRKRMGVMVIIFLLVMTGLFYYSKKKIWSDVH
ncbi:MAG: cytochrome c1 [Nisaea sp.]|nr:cytochrome c1 [Nisaea sp.]